MSARAPDGDDTRPAGVAARLRTVVRARLPTTRLWRRDLPAEVEYWRRWIASGGGDWPQDMARRLDPTAPLEEPLLTEILAASPAREIRILDVGAGPLTSLGKTYPGKELQLTAVDPLADEYNRLLDDAGLRPPVRTATGQGESLLASLAPASFDIAYARNALDHSIDPRLVIRNMLELVRPGGHVVLRHYEAEGTGEALHFWSFELEGDDLVIAGRDGRHRLSQLIAPEVRARCLLEGGSDLARWVTCVLSKPG